MEIPIPSWSSKALRYRCECQLCRRLGDDSPHHAPSHDQRLDQTFEFRGPLRCGGNAEGKCEEDSVASSGVSLRFVGGTTKCARVMAAWMIENADLFRGLNILEVGSGTGLVGIVLHALCDARLVCLTDQEPMMETVQYNIQLNVPKWQSDTNILDWQKVSPPPQSEAASPVSTSFVPAIASLPLQWGGEYPRLFGPKAAMRWDLLVGSDLIFAHENIPPLVRTFCAAGRQVYLASITRFDWEQSFFELMKKSFQCKVVHTVDDIKVFRFTPL